MKAKLFVIHCLFASSFAWLPPERCSQNPKSRSKRHVNMATVEAESASEIDKIAAKQTEDLKNMYVNHTFIGVQPNNRCLVGYNTDLESYEAIAPHNCKFHTYTPRLLATVGCSDVGCKLSHTVTTVETYTASEGYNWGVTVSAKASFFEKLFEVGGEITTGGTYSCTYTRGKNTSDLVECSDSTGVNGQIQLYNVQTDMMCDFGGIVLMRESRDNQYGVNITSGYFTASEIEELRASAQRGQKCTDFFLLDPGNVSDILLQKILDAAPLYNPYTDLILVSPELTKITYFKVFSSVNRYKHIIPFTNEGGDSIYQYACIKTKY